MSAPWMPLYIADYLADTAHLSAAESGAYLHLIMNYWRHGKLPGDDVSMARIARMSGKEWARSKAILQAFFHDGWQHKRIDFELEKSQRKSDARAEFGSRGGTAKALKDKNEALAKATNLPDNSPPFSNSFAVASSSQPQPQFDTDVSNKRAKDRAAAAELLIEFEGDFWPAYPHKVGKADAVRAFGKARGKVELADMLAALRRYAAKTDDRPWCNPATWLNGERWKDQPAVLQARAGPRSANGFHSMFDSENNFNGGGYGKSEQSFGIPGGCGRDAPDGGTIRPAVEIFEPDRANRRSVANR